MDGGPNHHVGGVFTGTIVVLNIRRYGIFNNSAFCQVSDVEDVLNELRRGRRVCQPLYPVESVVPYDRDYVSVEVKHI